MQTLLGQLNGVPGVIGSMVCDADGRILAQVFPPTFAAANLQGAASALADRTGALEEALGSVGLVDLRYAGARLVIRAMQGARLLFLCAPSINLELLGMAAAGAVRKIEKSLGSPAAPPPAPEAATAGQLYAMVQRIETLIERSKGDAFKLRGQIALKAGFALDLIDPGSPDDPALIRKLREAAAAVLGQPV